MSDLISYLSGNVPGGIFLYVFVIFMTLLILLYIYWVNELFLGRHLIRWSLAVLLIFSIIYWGYWFKNPSHHLYRRYSILMLQSNTKDNWFGEYITDLLTKNIKPYKTDREYLFPYYWFFKITPTDSSLSPKLIKHICTTMPVHKVLKGSINKNGKALSVSLQLVQYPDEIILGEAEERFNIYELDKLLIWIRSEFNGDLPFQLLNDLKSFSPPDSLLQMVRRYYYMKKYDSCLKLLTGIDKDLEENLNINLYRNYITIKKAGLERMKSPPKNPYGSQKPQWEKDLNKSRNFIINYLQAGFDDGLANIVVAESDIWKEEYSSAEIFLENSYVDNPFDIDVISNLVFLHPSRYKEFGFSNTQDIYKQILTLCPFEEITLLKWSDDILNDNPSFTAPPKFAKKYVKRYLLMNPYSYKVWLMLGKIYAHGLDREEALHAYLKADSLYPNDGMINYNIGVLLYEWEKYDKALEFLKHSVECDDYLDSHLYIGAIYKVKGEYEKALEEFRFRVARKVTDDDRYAYEAMKGIREILEIMNQKESN
jgi:tetratricopeptide (TPR) repeat protein